MKKIFKYLAIVAAGAVLASCNKAEFKTTNFVSFYSSRAMMPEACGIYEIPVNLYNTDAAIVTYMVTDGTAVKGEDYEIVDKNGNPDLTGVLNLKSSEPSYIYVKVTDKTGILTKNLTFSIDLVSSATDGVVMGATRTCACTIIDADAGINLLLGHWSGDGVDKDGAPTDLTFDIDVIDIDDPANEEIKKIYPDCNFVISGMSSVIGDFDQRYDIYGKFDQNTSTASLYGLQVFQQYNFGEAHGVKGVAFGPSASSLAQLNSKEPVLFTLGDEELILNQDTFVWIVNDDGTAYQGYAIGNFAEGFTLKKID